MLKVLDKHKIIGGGKGVNTLTYLENCDEDFNTGELNGVESVDGLLKIKTYDEDGLIFHLDCKTKTDISEFNHNVVSNNTCQIVQGKYNEALKDSSADIIKVELPNLLKSSSKDFTIEWWVKRDAINNNLTTVRLQTSLGALAYIGHRSNVTDVGKLGTWLDVNSKGSWQLHSLKQGENTLNDWVHLVFQKRGRTYSSYENGKLVDSKSIGYDITITNSVTLTLHSKGTENNTASYEGLKVYNKAKYSENFTPIDPMISFKSSHRISPTIKTPNNLINAKCNWDGEGKISCVSLTQSISNLDLDNTMLFIRGDSFKDESSFNRKITNVGADIIEDTTFGKCISMPRGSNKYFNASIPLDFSIIDFTIDWWENVTDNGDTFQANGTGINKNGACIGFCNNTGGARGLTYTDNSDRYTVSPGFGNQAYNTWNHWAITRRGTVCKVYYNGILTHTQTIPSSLKSHTGEWCIGKYYPGVTGVDNCINGKLANFRVSTKVLWDSDFTPPKEYTIPETVITPLAKNETIKELPSTFQLKQELDGEETISNVQLEMKYKLGKEYVVPSEDVVPEEDSVLWLYKEGDERVGVTGGWKADNSSYNVSTPTYERSSEYLRAHIVCGNSNGHHCGFCTSQSVDLTNFTSICFDMSNYHQDEYDRGLIYIQQGSSVSARIGSPKYENASRQVRRIDVSNLNGNFDIRILAETVWSGKQAEVKIYKIWLEK